MINKNLLNKLDELGFGSDVDKLESYVASLQDAAGMGEPMVTNEVYDMYYKLLKEVKPSSLILTRNWEEADEEFSENDDILKAYGMKSINTIKEMSDLNYFKTLMANEELDDLEMFAGVKLNGHAVRAVYKNGYLISGTTRGRYKKGRDITRHLKRRLPNYIEKWKGIELVEVRGEAVVSFKNFEKVKHLLKTPLSSVTSFIKESAVDSEIDLLDIVCYKIIFGTDVGNNGFNTLQDEYEELEELGFQVPIYTTFDDFNLDEFEDKIDDIVSYFEELRKSGVMKYDSDGIVVSINDNKLFYGLGNNGNTWLGNFALKMGDIWGTRVYTSKVIDIEWKYGKSYITPKAIVEPVKTSNGSNVSVVPLYNVGVMERFHIVPGSTVFFLYGGETGVSLCDAAGNKVTDKV